MSERQSPDKCRTLSPPLRDERRFMEKVLTLYPDLKAFHENPNIETLKKCEEVLKKHSAGKALKLMNFIVGDISYNGPKDVDFSDTDTVYNYVRYFFNIDLLIHNAAKSSDFWVHVLKLLTKTKELDGKDAES